MGIGRGLALQANLPLAKRIGDLDCCETTQFVRRLNQGASFLFWQNLAS